MKTFRKKFQVKPNAIGYLFRKNVFDEKLSPGIYKYWDFSNELDFYMLSSASKLITITNQEVLSKDNIAFRFSFSFIYKIVDGEKFLGKFLLDKGAPYIIAEAEQRIWNMAQLHVRNIISTYDSEELNDKRAELGGLQKEVLNEKLQEYGIEIEEMDVKDMTFPKNIQELFSRQLEAKIRAKADLENARTAVATARTLKNAAELMKDDENVRFYQILETINKIAAKGKNTFMIGDINQLTKK